MANADSGDLANFIGVSSTSSFINKGVILAEVDQAMERLQSSLVTMQESGGAADNGSFSISSQDAEWLLAEIAGGREAFATLVQQKEELAQQVASMRRTIDHLLAMRGKP